MRLANEVYHHNFGIALAAKPPIELNGESIAVRSRTSASFAYLYKSYSPKIYRPLEKLPQVILPPGADYSSRVRILPFFDSADPIFEKRETYLRLRRRWLDGKCETEDVLSGTEVYQQALNELLFDTIRYPRIAGHIINAAVSAGATVLSLIGAIPPDLAHQIVATTTLYSSTDFLLPTFAEKLNMDALLFKLPGSSRLLPRKWQDLVESRGYLSSMVVDRAMASHAVKGLSAW